MTPTSTADLLGPAAVDDEALTGIVADVLGRPVELDEWAVNRVAYEVGSPATGALLRVSGTTRDGAHWSVFVKVLHHVRHWPMLHLVPPPLQAEFLGSFPWRAELEAWRANFAGRLPHGLRVPRLHRAIELGDDRVALWMEDVQVGAQPWTIDRFAVAAHRLGGLAARRCDDAVLAECGLPRGYALRKYVEGRVLPVLTAVHDDDLWAHPLLADTVDPYLRSDLDRLGERLPGILDRLDVLPQSLPHGDASPQNLLVPADEPGTFVMIDISFQCPAAIGFDLGQLLVGLAHAGEMRAERLADVDAVLVPAFTAGARANGLDVDPVDVAYGYHGGLAARAAFTALPFELLERPAAEVLATFRERAALARYLVNLGLALD